MAARVKGLAAVTRRLQRVERAAYDALVEGLRDEAEIVLARSRDLAPQLTGQMIRNSGVRVQAHRATQTIQVAVFYDEPYAVKQHEGYFNPGPITSVKLGPSFAIGRKFLTKAIDERRQQLVAQVGRRVERALRLTLR